MNDTSIPPMSRLQAIAEFRFQVRNFLHFSEMSAEAAGISAQQYQLLQVVAAGPEHGASISYLADRMVLRHNSTVELVDRAVRAGLVRRESDEEDLRRSLVVMTPDGIRVLERLLGEHLAELDTHGPEILEALERLRQTGIRHDQNGASGD